MNRRSKVDVGICFKNLHRILPHPWVWTKLAALQSDKWFFSLQRGTGSNGLGGKIRQVSFRITDLCNLRCTTCGQWGESGFLRTKDPKMLRKEEVPPGRYVELLEDLVQQKHRPTVYIWGGEPMLYGGTLELIERSTKLGLPVAIATNGSRVSHVAERLVGAPLFLLQVSIDGHCASLHNRIRPSAGEGNNFAEIESALHAVRDVRRVSGRSLPLIVALTVISRENVQHLLDIYDTFRRRVDLFVFYLSWWIDDESAVNHERDFRRRFGFEPKLHRGWLGSWRPDDFAALDLQLRELKARSLSWDCTPVMIMPEIMGIESLQRYYTEHEQTFGYNQCVSIFHAVEIDSNGNLSPCRDYHDYVVGNVKSSTITELWNSDAYRRFRQSIAQDGLMPVCTRCCGLMGY